MPPVVRSMPQLRKVTIFARPVRGRCLSRAGRLPLLRLAGSAASDVDLVLRAEVLVALARSAGVALPCAPSSTQLRFFIVHKFVLL